MQRERTWRRVWMHAVTGLTIIAAAAGVAVAAEPAEGRAEPATGPAAQAAVATVEAPAAKLAVRSDAGSRSASCIGFGGTSSTAPEPSLATALGPIPGPLPGDNCPNWRCSQDFECANECAIPNCPPPCGACIYETSEPCSGFCICR